MRYLIAAILMSPFILSASANADSFTNFSEAAGDSAEASSRVIAAGGQVALGAAAIPLSVIGSGADLVGEASHSLSDELWTAANAPLKVDDDVVIAVPPPSLTSTSQKEGH